MPLTFDIRDAPPPLHEFIDFRTACGWGTLDAETAQKTLSAGLVNVTAYEDDRAAGFGRIVGDGAIYFYVQDLIVGQDYRGHGLGTRILETLIARTRIIAAPGASIGLMSAAGKEVFYEALDFARRPNDRFGAGMTLVL